MKMWEGRFEKATAGLMETFNNSLPVDKTLIEEDIAGSMAWALALAKAKVLTKAESQKIVAGLGRILRNCRNGKVRFLASDEDIHMAVERLLVQDIGAAGEKLHTGRSRNDQVATDFRLYTKKSLVEVRRLLCDVQAALLRRAEADNCIVAPGFTHLQQAQPVNLAHYWLSLFFCLEREKDRLAHAIGTADVMPLGAGALAGSGFRIDRRAIAKQLGFGRVSENSMDAVASRDFALEALACLSSIGIHLSRYAEDLIIWSSREFGFVELSDAWSTGSSMMPQKKNPDSLELIRGKAGRLIGNYTRLAATLKGVGLTYFKDLQEDKEPLFDSVNQVSMMCSVFTQVVRTLAVNRKRIAADLDSFLFATDLADYLVRKDVPFRAAHKIVGCVVGLCVKTGLSLSQLTLAQYKEFSPLFAKDVYRLFDWQKALAGRDVEGGTGPTSVARQMKLAREILKEKR